MTIIADSRQFRHLVDIQTPDGDLEDFTDTDATWTLVNKQWAQITPLAGDEQVAAQQINPRVTHRIRTRWQHDIDTTRLRFQWNSRTFWVASARNADEYNHVWEFICSEEKA